MRFESIKLKSIYIIGLGISGLSLAKRLNTFCHKLYCWDDSEKIRKVAKKYALCLINILDVDLNDFDYVILSSGISDKYISCFKKTQKFKLVSDIEFLRFILEKTFLIGITGTNGKSTTTKMLEHTLDHMNAKIAGNIGIPFSELKLNKRERNILIIETSSYQLERIDKLRFKIAILLNISSDHLDRHKTMKNYVQAKLNIFKNQSQNDFALICVDDNYCKKVKRNFKKKFQAKPIFFSVKEEIKDGIFLKESEKFLQINDKIHNETISICKKNLIIRGQHNYQNLLATYIVNRLIKSKTKKFIEGIESFPGLEHRFEKFEKFKNISFFNDSKSTNLNSSLGALENLENVYWIAGGLSKVDGFKGVEKYLNNVKNIYLFGKDRLKLLKYFKGKEVVKEFNNLNLAFECAFESALKKKKNINLLFSPACASFDQFKNFEERGRKFKLLVKRKILSYKKNGKHS